MSKSVPLRYVVISFAALVVAAGAVIVIVLTTRPTSLPASTETPAAATTFTMRGSIELQNERGSGTNVDSPNGHVCRGRGGYSDIAPGSAVTVQNVTGQVVATGSLTYGVATTIPATYAWQLDRVISCSMSFEVPNVPDGLSSYSVTVTHRGTQVIPKDQAHGEVRLTLG